MQPIATDTPAPTRPPRPSICTEEQWQFVKQLVERGTSWPHVVAEANQEFGTNFSKSQLYNGYLTWATGTTQYERTKLRQQLIADRQASHDAQATPAPRSLADATDWVAEVDIPRILAALRQDTEYGFFLVDWADPDAARACFQEVGSVLADALYDHYQEASIATK